MGSFDVQIIGGKQVYEFGRRFHEAPKKAQAATRRQLNTAVKPLQDAIRDEIEPVMPKGYEQVLSKSIRFRVTVKPGYWAAVTLTTSARGQKKLRDIRALDKGVLRHPVFGRFRVSHKQKRFIENPWVAQSIKAGFWTRPVRTHKSRVQRDVSKVIVDSLRDAVKG